MYLKKRIQCSKFIGRKVVDYSKYIADTKHAEENFLREMH